MTLIYDEKTCEVKVDGDLLVPADSTLTSDLKITAFCPLNYSIEFIPSTLIKDLLIRVLPTRIKKSFKDIYISITNTSEEDIYINKNMLLGVFSLRKIESYITDVYESLLTFICNSINYLSDSPFSISVSDKLEEEFAINIASGLTLDSLYQSYYKVLDTLFTDIKKIQNSILIKEIIENRNVVQFTQSLDSNSSKIFNYIKINIWKHKVNFVYNLNLIAFNSFDFKYNFDIEKFTNYTSNIYNHELHLESFKEFPDEVIRIMTKDFFSKYSIDKKNIDIVILFILNYNYPLEPFQNDNLDELANEIINPDIHRFNHNSNLNFQDNSDDLIIDISDTETDSLYDDEDVYSEFTLASDTEEENIPDNIPDDIPDNIDSIFNID